MSDTGLLCTDFHALFVALTPIKVALAHVLGFVTSVSRASQISRRRRAFPFL